MCLLDTTPPNKSTANNYADREVFRIQKVFESSWSDKPPRWRVLIDGRLVCELSTKQLLSPHELFRKIVIATHKAPPRFPSDKVGYWHWLDELLRDCDEISLAAEEKVAS
jgi:hypothetical protein